MLISHDHLSLRGNYGQKPDKKFASRKNKDPQNYQPMHLSREINTLLVSNQIL